MKTFVLWHLRLENNVFQVKSLLTHDPFSKVKVESGPIIDF